PVSRVEFDAVVFGFVVVERREREGLAELPIVKQVLGAFVVDVGADLQAWTVCRSGRLAVCSRRTLRQQLLHEAGVDHMCPLRQNRTDILQRLAGHLAGQDGNLVGGDDRGAQRGAVAGVKGLDWSYPAEHLRRRRESPHVADMHYGRPPRLITEARARTE